MEKTADDEKTPLRIGYAEAELIVAGRDHKDCVGVAACEDEGLTTVRSTAGCAYVYLCLT